jgi:hypothetical protein
MIHLRSGITRRAESLDRDPVLERVELSQVSEARPFDCAQGRLSGRTVILNFLRPSKARMGHPQPADPLGNLKDVTS